MSAFHSLIRLIDHSLYGFRVPYTTRPVFKYITLPTSPFLSHPVGLLLLLLAALGWRPGPDQDQEPGPVRPSILPKAFSSLTLFAPNCKEKASGPLRRDQDLPYSPQAFR